jgi:hypothetical protein
VPGSVLSSLQTHLIPRKTLWVLLCPFYKLGSCFQVKLISVLPVVMERQSWDPGLFCLVPKPVPLITVPALGTEWGPSVQSCPAC